MKLSHLYLTVIFVSVIALSCKDNSIQPFIPSAPKYTIERMINAPLELKHVSIGDSVLNIRYWAPFQLVLTGTTLFGSDGCNYYDGKYRATNDSINVLEVGGSLVACFPNPPIESSKLKGRWKVEVCDTALHLKRGDTDLTFSGKYIQQIRDSSFTYSTWRLKSSNDTDLTLMKSLELLPTIMLTNKRKFELQWCFLPQNIKYTSNMITGIFGIGVSSAITMIGKTFRYYPPYPYSWAWYRDRAFMERIIASTNYSYTDSTFRLENRSEGFFYNFVKMPQER